MDTLDGYYRILGLEPGASLEKVKQTYRDLVNVWHPDRFSHDPRLQRTAEEKLREINAAYERLDRFFQERGNQPYKPYKPQPYHEPPRSRSNKSQKPLKPRSGNKTTPKFVYQLDTLLVELESKLRAMLRRVGISLPPLRREDRIKAALFLVAAIYLLVAAVCLVVVTL